MKLVNKIKFKIRYVIENLLVIKLAPKFKIYQIIWDDMFSSIVSKNRVSNDNSQINLNKKLYQSSIINYGVPKKLYPFLNKKINNVTNYTDLIVYLSKNAYNKKEELSYLEIGASFGRNFYQIVENSIFKNCTAIEIEDINPSLSEKFNSYTCIKDWNTPKKSPKKSKSKLLHLAHSSKKVHYLNGDLFDQNLWLNLAPKEYNFIFSDAWHTKKAIIHEIKQLIKYNLISQKGCIIIWDDLSNNAMISGFYEIINRIRINFPNAIIQNRIFKANGWLGQFENPHTMGIVSINTKIESFFC